MEYNALYDTLYTLAEIFFVCFKWMTRLTEECVIWNREVGTIAKVKM